MSNEIAAKEDIELHLTSTQLYNKIDALLKYCEKYARQRTEPLKRIKKDLENQEYKIAVVANMSSGKSTFINALFGEEVLPAFTHATTDSATFIYSRSGIEKKMIVYFNDGREKIKIDKNIETEIKQYAQKDDECEEDKYKNVEKIELFYPFKYLQTSSSEDFSIVFIDTPGPNSTGEGYSQKHKDQTRSVLNEVDLVLFMFDYTQLDANLESDEQGLWKTIQKRHNIDQNFDVYFLLNKIDYALNDNFKEIKDIKDKDEFIKRKKESWMIHEKIAIEKLRKAAIKHGILDPKIYPISSKYQLLQRDDNKNWDAEDELDSFKKSHFQRLFNDSWEREFIDYLGIEKLELDINKYIDTEVKNKILKKLNFQYTEIANEEKKGLEYRLQTLKKPKENAEENLQKAIYFLSNEAKRMESEFKEESQKIQKKHIEKIKHIIDNNIEKELRQNTKEATLRTIKFLELLLAGYSKGDAIESAKILPKEKIKRDITKTFISIKAKEKVDIEATEKSLQEFIKSILNDYKNNYLDMRNEIKNDYSEMAEEIGALFSVYKDKMNKELDNTLEIDVDIMDENVLYDASSFSENIKVPDSTISYQYQSAKYKDGGSFSERKKIRNEKHKIIIDPTKIEKIFVLSIDSMKRTYYNNEIKRYEKVITEFVKSYQDRFYDFKQEKYSEIKQIKKDLENKKQALDNVEKQYDEFRVIIEERKI